MRNLVIFIIKLTLIASMLAIGNGPKMINSSISEDTKNFARKIVTDEIVKYEKRQNN